MPPPRPAPEPPNGPNDKASPPSETLNPHPLKHSTPETLFFCVPMPGPVPPPPRTPPKPPRPYRTRGYPFVPALYVILATLLTLDLVYLAPGTSGLGFLIVLTGLPVYLAWRRTGR